MHTLNDVQEAFAAAILYDRPGRLSPHVASVTLAAERRIRIYRNHFTISLTECLAVTFPVLKALVGENYFNQCARRFAADYPPPSPVLFEYGEAFPRFLAEMTRSENFAYLADVGAFEWAINRAYHADDADPMRPQALLSAVEERRDEFIFHLHPSASLVASDYPILDIWRANQAVQSDGSPDTVIDLARGGIRLLVWRHGGDVVWQRLGTAEAAFVAVLLGRSPLDRACVTALAEDPQFQPVAMLADLIESKVLAGFSLASDPTER